MRSLKSYLPWAMLLLAVSAWGMVGYFAWDISGAEGAQAARDAALLEEQAQFEANLRVHALARETSAERTQLEQVGSTDLLSIVEAIENVGEDANVLLEIHQVAADAPIPAASPDVPAIRPVNAVIEVQGAFSRLVHVAALLHALPLPSEIHQMQFERIPREAGGTGGTWRFVARIRVFTTADISS